MTPAEAYRAALRAQGWHLPAECPVRETMVASAPSCMTCDDELDTRPLPPEVQAACDAAIEACVAAARGCYESKTLGLTMPPTPDHIIAASDMLSAVERAARACREGSR